MNSQLHPHDYTSLKGRKGFEGIQCAEVSWRIFRRNDVLAAADSGRVGLWRHRLTVAFSDVRKTSHLGQAPRCLRISRQRLPGSSSSRYSESRRRIFKQWAFECRCDPRTGRRRGRFAAFVFTVEPRRCRVIRMRPRACDDPRRARLWRSAPCARRAGPDGDGISRPAHSSP